MFRTVKDFEKEWGEELESTLKLLRPLTDPVLTQKVAPEHRTLGRLAWHLVQSQVDMINKTGLSTIEGPDWETPIPEHAGDIVSAYERVANAILKAAPGWADAALLEEREMYGPTPWANGYTLEVLIRHEAHHRGQMTVLMRQAGLPVAGPYGPSKDEWAAYGMAAME
jgi:uncharacterized damage-inducible protein DinB